MNILSFIDVVVNNIFAVLGVFAPILACILIVIESMIPILPLALFITINFYYLGGLLGFIISWIFTCIGCYLSFILCRNKLKSHFDNMLSKKEHKRLKKLLNKINDFKFEELVILIAIPFFPAFMINIAAGLSNMGRRKFISSIIIGKIFLVFFWGYIGTSLIESFKNPVVFIKIGVLLLIAFIVSKLINKKFRLE